MTAPDIETVVVGAGLVGLAAARALALAGHDVLVLERHAAIGQETSSRSSEVIHAGLYYPPGSLRAKFCVEGRRLLYEFARETGVPVARCGKLLVATAAADCARLDALAANARACGVKDLASLTAAEARALEPELSCAAAVLSPSTGVIDSHALLVALEGHLRAEDGNVVLNHAVEEIGIGSDGTFELSIASGTQAPARLTARNLVLAAGLGATRLGTRIPYRPGYRVPQVYPARGHYYALASKAPFRHLVYPMPDSGWLGIHLTLDIAGRAKFGPDLEWQDGEPSYVFDEQDGARRAAFEAEIRRYWPGLPGGALHPAYVGVRPKIYKAGEPVADFAIHGASHHGVDRLVALYGIESPGLTSSLAIGAHVAGML
ncbi:NAD(P)/FAD-dependent oxidoreductase [Hyphomicrobium sp.]|uniref:NAD(P)/FAD-dependent oxidoreductase n=1 Tax=Hyphomicrobium sp. TaxID=82 RepID=UPI003F6F6BD1